MASLPAAHAGENPFQFYLNILQSELFPTVPDTKTFAVRVWALVGVCAYGVLISLLYGGSVLVQHRRRSSSWVARKVDGYLTLNLNFFVPFGGALSCLSMLAYTVLQYHLFTLPHPSSSRLYAINTFRTFSWIPLVLHGYFVTASAAQASLVVSNRARETTTTEVDLIRGRFSLRRWILRTPSPSTANMIFWVGLAAISLTLLIPDILFSVSWRRAYACIGALQTHLVRQAAAWSPTDGTSATLPGLIKTSTLYGHLTEEVKKNRVYQRAVVYALILTPLFLAFTTLLASLLLHSLLRLQIRTRTARAAAQSTLLADVHTFASPLASPQQQHQPMRFEVAFPSARKQSVAAAAGVDVELDDLYEDDEEADEERDYPVPHEATAFKAAQPILSLPPPPTNDKPASAPPLPSPFSIDFLPVFPSFPSAPPAAHLPSSSPSSAPTSPTTSRRPSLLSFHPPSFHRSSRSRRSSTIEDQKRRGSLATLEHACLAVKRARDAARADEELGELKRAERELGVCATVVLLLSLSLGIENTWNVVRVVPTSFTDLSWTEIEASYFLPPFFYVTIYSTAITLLMAFNFLLAPSSTSSSCSPSPTPPSFAPSSSAFAVPDRPKQERRGSRLSLFMTGGERGKGSDEQEEGQRTLAVFSFGSRTEKGTEALSTAV